jgi:hypothetical protein
MISLAFCVRIELGSGFIARVPLMVKPPLESAVETELVMRVRAAGGIAEKVQVLGRRGFFDRLVLLPDGRVIFVECKRPRTGRLSAHQIERHRNYRLRGAVVVIVLCSADIDRLLGDREPGPPTS